VIADITRRMGAGMADFIQTEEVATLEQYDLYCHYVAGLVGIGLSQMFGARGRGRRGGSAARLGRGGSCSLPSWSLMLHLPLP
jgi:phytoene/squalene synthetase